jgi:hypothetical protein
VLLRAHREQDCNLKFPPRSVPITTTEITISKLRTPGNLVFSLCGLPDSVQLILRFCGVSMKDSAANIRTEEGRLLNSISLQNAVLCADCDMVSDSPHDHCMVCGSRSLFNISRLLGGMLPNERAMLIDAAREPSTLPHPVLRFPRTRRVFNSRQRAKVQRDSIQSKLFR